ncbi:MAG: PAS domain-containing protein [Chitinivibrionales bacterium]|nr:PAS domain-containing protein [Chitinivibrionales bacterium]MBD3358581.1 PAS domain-containing protein [Chitinivibrionales bacterium]
MDNQCRVENDRLSPGCYETILQAMAEAVLILDTDGIIRHANRAMERLSARNVTQLRGRQCSDILVCACSTTRECDLFRKGRLDGMECALRRPDGTTVPILKNGRLLYDENGSVMGAVETLTDISILKRTEGRLAELEESVRNRGRFGRIIGKSRAMDDVLKLVELAAASNATVLIQGETGTGKELIAEAIHNASDRRGAPLVKVNCSALPESLLESELFGHTRGAFTGAVQDKVGRFERAEGGTLFLDEIGEVSPLIQVKLLRFLQEKEFERVGESITRKADVRILAATHRNLRSRAAAGEFRDDLYYRLKVFPIHLPPLRERKEDIGLLVDYFIAKYRQETGRTITGLTHDAAVTLMDYCWPGNVRELENAVEHAFVTCQEGLIDIFDLPLDIRKVELRGAICRSETDEMEKPPTSTTMRPRDITREELVELLRKYRWNKTSVARHLGFDRSTVWRKMKQMGISLEPTE